MSEPGATPPLDDENAEARADAAVAAYVDRLNAGERLDPLEVIADHPTLGEQILEGLETFVELGSGAAAEPLGAIGDYTLRRRLGRGGMGVVYEAWERSMDRAVALKVLPTGMAADDKAYMRFMREARTAGKLSHPNVVSVYGVGVKEQTPYYAMELVDGRSLGDVLVGLRETEPDGDTVFGRKDCPAYFGNLASAFADVADGLQHAHSRGVVHRDIKPSNLILDRDGRLRILDFGLARLEGQESLTLTGDLVGTPLYMSPEQARRRNVRIDHRTDIYSLGATMYAAIGGRPPFSGRDHAETLFHIVEREAPGLRRTSPRIPRALETIVMKCLRKAPAERYGTAEALAQDLRRFVRGDPIEARPRSPIERWTRRAWSARGKLAVALLVVLLLAALAGLLSHRVRETSAARERAYRDEVLAGVLRLQLGQMTTQLGAGTSIAMSPEGFFREGDLDRLAEGAGLTINPIDDGIARLERAAAVLPHRPEALYHRARGLALLGRRDEALVELERAVRAAADFVPALALERELAGASADVAWPLDVPRWAEDWLVARESVQAGRWNEAARALERLVTPFAGGDGPYLGASIEFHLGLGLARFKLGELHAALESFVAARTLWPRVSEPRLLVGMVYLEMRHAELAKAAFEDLYARPGVLEDEVALWVAALYKHYKEYREGRRWARRIRDESIRLRLDVSFSTMLDPPGQTERLCREAIERFPRDQRFRHTLAVVLLRIPGKQEEALAVAREALAMDPQRIATVCLLAAALRDNGEREEAESLLRDVIAAHPEEPRAYDQLGGYLFDRKSIEEAERLYMRAVELVERDPHHHILDPMVNWGQRLVALGRVQEAAVMYERAIAASPSSASAHASWGKLLKMQGELARAEAMCRKALALAPEHVEARRDLGLVLWAKGAREEALEALEAAFARDPSYTYAHASLAWARDELGLLEASLADCARSIEAAPRDVWNHRRLIELSHRAVEGGVSVGRLWDRVLERLESRRDDGGDAPTAVALRILARLHGDAARSPQLALELAMKSAERTEPFLRIARASALFDTGDRRAAIRALEELDRLNQVPGFLPEKLASYRWGALPEIASIESAEALVGRSQADLQGLLARLPRAPGPDGSDVGAYLEGRALQLAGRHDEAVASFEALRPSAGAPLVALRLAECLDAAGKPAAGVAVLDEALEADASQSAVWETWFRLGMHAGRSPDAMLRSLPASESGDATPLRALLESLDAGRPFRIDCGGRGFVDSDGNGWAADCFFRGGVRQSDAYVVVANAPHPELYRHRRVFLAYEAHASYRVPVPSGRHRVSLHMAETLVNGGLFPKRFDVEMEGRTVLERVGPAGFSTATTFTVDVDVEDALLEIVFHAADEHPAVSGIEIARIP